MLEKLKKQLLGVNVPLAAFSLYLMKVLFISPSYPEVIVLISVSALYGYKMKVDPLTKRMIKPNQKLEEDVAELKSAMSKINISSLGRPKKKF